MMRVREEGNRGLSPIILCRGTKVPLHFSTGVGNVFLKQAA